MVGCSSAHHNASPAQTTDEHPTLLSVKAHPSVLDVHPDADVLFRDGSVLLGAHVAPEILAGAAPGAILTIERAFSSAVLASDTFRGSGLERFFVITFASPADALAFFGAFGESGLFASIDISAPVRAR